MNRWTPTLTSLPRGNPTETWMLCGCGGSCRKNQNSMSLCGGLLGGLGLGVWLRVWSNSLCCVCEACNLQHGVKAVGDTPENCLPLQERRSVCLHASDKGIIGTWCRRVRAILREASPSVI